VGCIKIWQSQDPGYKADRIALQEVYESLTGAGKVDGEPPPMDYVTIAVFEAVSGGHWAQRPAVGGTMWMVRNLSPLIAPWAVTELQFFEDQLCTMPIYGKPISSGTYGALMEGENNVFDGDLLTHWRAQCPWAGCAMREAWIGLDFGTNQQRKVRCMRIYQSVNDPMAKVSEYPSFTFGFELMEWGGKDWGLSEVFWDPAVLVNVPATLRPTLASPFMGGAPGVWE
ncbi:unnamed protein product, partial [Polarella glacialis]